MKKAICFIVVLFLTHSFANEYQVYLNAVKQTKLKYQNAYKTSLHKDSVLLSAGLFLEEQITNSMFEFWKGTPWDFYGTTDVPKQGKIACGYYVSTSLKHLGWNVNRYKLAQQTPLNEIQSLDPKAEIIIGGHSVFMDYLKNKATDGLYMIGLSNHVGMIFKKDTNVYFLHSYFYKNTGVVKENAFSSWLLTNYDTFILGKISRNKEFVKKWLTDEEVHIQTDAPKLTPIKQ